MDLEENYNHVLKLIKYAQKDSNLELEMIVKQIGNNKLSNEKFTNLVRRLKGYNSISLSETTESLDISFGTNNRLTIKGVEYIKQYCKTNDIRGIPKENMVALQKENVQFRDIHDYGIKFNLKRETDVDLHTEPISNELKKWRTIDKVFRYKKRFSFTTEDRRFQFDLTVVKSSNKNIIRGENTTRQKKEVKDHMKKYVVKPEYVTDFNKWFNGLKSNEIVELIGKKRIVMIPSKKIQNSNVFTNDPEFEVELEYIGNKMRYKGDPEEVLNEFITNTGIVLQSIQNTYYLTSEKQKNEVRAEYKAMFKNYRFMGPQLITVGLNNIIEKRYEDYRNGTNIRKNYTVTDKADGERNLMIVSKNSGVYLLNRREDIKYIGCKLPGLEGTVLDGEFIQKDKYGNPISLFMVFDVYFHNGTDTRDRILNRSEEQKVIDKLKESRIEVLSKIFTDDKLLPKYDNGDETKNVQIIKKKFYYGNCDEYDPAVDKEISRLETLLEQEKVGSPLYKEIKEKILNFKNDTRIFDETAKVYAKDYVYKIDGVIFTPINLRVGEKMFKPYNVERDYNGRWASLLKWKPPIENTIDFLVKFKKDPEDQMRDQIVYLNYKNKINQYKVLVLHVGYDPAQHTKHNSCKVMNEDLQFEPGYSPTPFGPVNPYRKNSHIAYVPIINGKLSCEDKSIIFDENIVEFRCNKDTESPITWIPTRVRETLKPNDFVTASSVWKSIHKPITTEMITTGQIDLDKLGFSSDTYYFNTTARDTVLTKPMADFHSFVKKSIIKDNTVSDGTLIDFACGKLGDLNHWLDANLNTCVGIDINYDNLENINNGACNRVLSKHVTDTNTLLDNTLLICGDSGEKILTSRFPNDDLNRYYTNIIMGEIDEYTIKNSKLRRFYGLAKKGFDTSSVQFSIHYFFKSEENLDNYLDNVSKTLKSGGKFVGTCLDGGRVFSALKETNNISSFEKDTLLWKITKKYDTHVFPNDTSSLGMKIDVYVESIGNTTEEYLVNMNLLIEKCKAHGLELIQIESFETLYTDLSKSKTKYGSSGQMTDGMRDYSFLNNFFVFEKV
jgi:hypothetical protein